MSQNQSWIISALFFGLIAFALSFMIMHEMQAVRAWAIWTGGIIGVGSSYLIYRFLSYASETNQVVKRISRLRKTTIRDIHEEAVEIDEDDEENLSELADFSRKLLFYNEEKIQETRLLLIRAGFYKESTLVRFLILKITLPIIGGIIAFLYAYLNGLALQTILLMTFAVAIIVWIMIDKRVETMGEERKEKIQQDLPDALDLLVIYAETGTAFDNALPKVADEMIKSSPEIATELKILNRELRLLSSRIQAYENFLERVPLQTLKSLIGVLRQSETVGTPIADAIKQIAESLRNERIMGAERRAARIPVLITLPLIAFIFPVLLLIIMGPVALQIIDGFAGKF